MYAGEGHAHPEVVTRRAGRAGREEDTMRRATGAIAVTVMAASAMALASPPAFADLEADTFTLKVKTTAEHYEDVGRRGESIGDTLVFGEKLFHEGERVGTSAVICHVTKARAGTIRLLCWATLSLRGHGDLTIHGKVVFREEGPAQQVLAVTGGTGTYLGASGTMTLDESRRAARYIIQLVP